MAFQPPRTVNQGRKPLVFTDLAASAKQGSTHQLRMRRAMYRNVVQRLRVRPASEKPAWVESRNKEWFDLCYGVDEFSSFARRESRAAAEFLTPGAFCESGLIPFYTDADVEPGDILRDVDKWIVKGFLLRGRPAARSQSRWTEQEILMEDVIRPVCYCRLAEPSYPEGVDTRAANRGDMEGEDDPDMAGLPFAPAAAGGWSDKLRKTSRKVFQWIQGCAATSLVLGRIVAGPWRSMGLQNVDKQSNDRINLNCSSNEQVSGYSPEKGEGQGEAGRHRNTTHGGGWQRPPREPSYPYRLRLESSASCRPPSSSARLSSQRLIQRPSPTSPSSQGRSP